MSDRLDNPEHERFALAYATLELASPDAPGNGSNAYRKVKPDATLKTCQNQATNLLKRPEVKKRVEALLLQGDGAEHIVHAGPFIDDLLMDTITMAREKEDVSVMLRAAELADRGRIGGALFVKETKSRRVNEGTFAGKSTKEIQAMRDAALRELAGVEPEELEAYRQWKAAPQIEASSDEDDEDDDGSPRQDAQAEARVGDEGRRSGPVQ